MNNDEKNHKDKLLGMLWGGIVGNALGIVYKYRYGSLPYNDRIQQHSSMDLGQISADAEMLLAALDGIMKSDGKFHKHTMVKVYSEWATSGGIGGNADVPDISQLMKLIFGSANYQHYNHAADFSVQNTTPTTINTSNPSSTQAPLKPDQQIQTYERVYDMYVTNAPQHKWSRDNESLLRSLAYMFTNKKDLGWLHDCLLSHPSAVVQEATDMLMVLLTSCVNSTYQFHYEPKQPDIQSALKDAQIRSHRDINFQRNDVSHAMYVALRCFLTGFTFTEGMNWIIAQHPNSDTCCNAGIGGAVIGAKIGLERMLKEDETFRKNLEIIKDCRSTRPEKYHPRKIDETFEQLFQLINK
jgi:ADP-ribosylglycohydrolase